MFAPAASAGAGTLDRSQIAAVLFDIDGTLMDSDDSSIAHWRMKIRRVSWLFPRRDPTAFLRRTLMSGEGLLNPAVAGLDVLGLRRLVLWLQQRAQGSTGCPDGKCPPVPGVVPLLRRLSLRYRLGVVTSRQRAHAEPFLRHLGVIDLFGAIVCLESTRQMKPSPEPIRLAARLLGVPVDHCLMVGDTSLDVAAAQRAGALSAGVLCGIGTRRDLRRADLILETTSDLESHLL